MTDLLTIARHVANNYHGDRDDLIQEAALGAWIATTTYNPARGVPLEKWQLIGAHGQVRRTIRRAYAYRRTATLVELNDWDAPAADDWDATDARLTVNALLEGAELDTRALATLYLTYTLGLSQREIAPLLGTNQRQVSRIVERACNTLRMAA